MISVWLQRSFFSLQARLISLQRLIGGIMGNEFTGGVLIGFNQQRQRNLNTKHETDAFALTLIFKFLLHLAELLSGKKKNKTWKRRQLNPASKCTSGCFVFGFLSEGVATNLDHDTYERTGNQEQNNVLCEPGGPQGPVLDADGAQHLFEPQLLLQHQALDAHAHGVHEGKHQHHGQHAADALDEAGCRRAVAKKTRVKTSRNTSRQVCLLHVLPFNMSSLYG